LIPHILKKEFVSSPLEELDYSPIEFDKKYMEEKE